MLVVKSLYSILFVSLFISCGSPKYEKFDRQEMETMSETDKPSGNSDDQIVEVVSFEFIKNRVLEKNCISCHPMYSIYSEVFKDKVSIVNSVLSNRMPKNSKPLPFELKNALETWVESGAPKNREGNDDEDNGDNEETGLEPIWKSISKNILFPKCVQCHNPNGEGSFLDLSSIEKIKEKKDYIIGDPGNAEMSLLYEVITDPFEPMPPQRSGLDRLNQEEINVIIEWIKKDLPK